MFLLWSFLFEVPNFDEDEKKTWTVSEHFLWSHTERTVDERWTLCERWPQSELRVQKSMWTMNAQWANSEHTVGEHKNGTVFNNNKVYNNVSETIVTTL